MTWDLYFVDLQISRGDEFLRCFGLFKFFVYPSWTKCVCGLFHFFFFILRSDCNTESKEIILQILIFFHDVNIEDTKSGLSSLGVPGVPWQNPGQIS